MSTPAYTKINFQNYPNKTTRISAERLDHIDDGIKNNNTGIRALETAVGNTSDLNTTSKEVVGAINEQQVTIDQINSNLTANQTVINGAASGTCTITQYGKMGHISFSDFGNANPTNIPAWSNVEISNITLNPKPNRAYRALAERVGSTEYFVEIIADSDGKVYIRNATATAVNGHQLVGELTFWVD